MLRIKLLPLLLILTMIISACGAEATPTINAADVQNTAIAAAFTVVAETQAAIPTNTPVPPTETPTQTPTPTETPVSLPTLQPTIAAPTQASPGNTGADPCNKPLGAKVTGHPAEIRIRNSTNGPVVVSLYLNLTEFGECGYRGYNLDVGGVITITDLPQGCYNVGVFVNDPERPSKAFGYGCITNPDTHTFDIFPEVVKFT